MKVSILNITLPSFIIIISWCLLIPSATALNHCFVDGEELKTAVSDFIKDGCSDGNNCNNWVVQTYGWPMGSWCVSNKVKSMEGIFMDQRTFNDDISSWDVSSVKKMDFMFENAASFNQDLSSWSVGNVRVMDYMFAGASSFNPQPQQDSLRSWDVSKVKSMVHMFSGATSFNGDISSWNVKSVMFMNAVFSGATSFNRDLSSWDLSSVKSMEGILQNATSFDQDLSSWQPHVERTTMKNKKHDTSFMGATSAMRTS